MKSKLVEKSCISTWGCANCAIGEKGKSGVATQIFE